ncbi:hypothetical protein BDF19DRAFT_416361 [Syncephalis fuscata]|nr:hypothetical protein BDF19DRAFT_416361 [Syncephalis fuscata]
MKRSASAITLVTQLPISHTTDGMSLNKRRMLEMNASPSPSLAGPRHGAYMPREGDYPHPPPPSHHSHSAATAAVTAPNMHLSYSPPHYQSTPPNYPVPPTAHAHYSSSSAHPRYPHTQQPLPPSHYYEANTSPATHHMSHAPRSHEHVYSGYASVEEMNNDRYGPAVTSAPIATNMDGSNYPRLTSMPAVNAMPTTGPGYISPPKSAAVMAHGYSISSSHQHHAIHQRQQQQHQQHPSHMPHGSPKSYYYPHPADSAAAYAHIRSANACGDPHCQNPHCGVTSVKPANPSEIYRPSSIPVSTPAAHMYTSRASDGPTTYHYPSASSALSAHPSSAIAANTRLPTPSSLSSPTTSASYPNGAGGPPLPPSSSTHHLDGYRANHSHGNAIYDNRMPQPLSSPYGQHRVASASSHGSYGHPHAYTPTTPISNTMTSIPASAPAISRTHTVFKHSDPRTANASHFYTMANTASTIPCRSQTPSNTNNH